MGNIEIELYWDHAPKTCENFHGLAAKNYYNGIIFHRIIAVRLARKAYVFLSLVSVSSGSFTIDVRRAFRF